MSLPAFTVTSSWLTCCRTLQSMFPNIDKEVIEDVVRAQEGNVGRAVDACLALSGGAT